MPEISLKAYFARLNNLLGVNSADEVIQHSRHILQSYPKNVTAYRFLGRALVLNGRWDEGREALRRVLSVYPDDYVAHLGLSEANEHLDHPDEAIWHLERAYEQNSNNKDIIDALRSLYRRYRNVENLKMQLTSAAVARQSLRSGAYTQAIDTLRSARARMNDRLDLKLLLAQILWEHGSQEESAEIAVEVLKVLPDCLEANRIMAKLWLSLDRPSDAQRYVNHLEAVDPYLAVEVVQGSAPDDDVFRLEELDYVRTSQSELASARPDWLQEISTSPPPIIETERETARDDWSSMMLGSQTPAAEPPARSVLSEQSMASRFSEISPQPEPIRTGGLTDLFGDPNAVAADEFSALFEASADHDEEDDGLAWMREAGIELVEPEDQQPNFDTLFGSDADDNAKTEMDSNPMAWMRDAGVETLSPEDQEPDFESLFANDLDNRPLPEMDANPMAWLEGANSDLILESDPPLHSESNADDIYSWMQDEEIDSQDLQLEASPIAASVEDDHESLDWLQNDHLLDEALSLEGHLSGDFAASQPRNRDSSAFSGAVIDGQNDMLDQSQSPALETNEPAAPGARRGLTAILQEANFDWVNQEQPENAGSDDEMDDWLNQFGPAQPRTAPTDAPDWLTDLGISETDESEDDEWFKTDESEHILPVSANGDQFVRMSGERPPVIDEPDDQEDDDGDWLSALAPDEETAEPEPEPEAEDDFSWMLADDPPAADTEEEAVVDTGALPDWLTDFVPPEVQADAPQAAVAQSVSEINWSAAVTPAADDEDSALSDWLTDLEPEDEDAAEVVDDAAKTANEFSWMSESAPENIEAAVQSPGLSDWLSELDAEGESEEEAEPAAEAAGDDMSWLSELEPASEAEVEPVATPVASDDLSWLAELEPDGEAEAEPAAVASDDLGWLSELEPVSEVEAEPAAVASDDLGWLSELEPDGAAEAEPVAAPVASDDLGWLAELEPASEAEAEPAAVSVEDFPWMNADPSTDDAAFEAVEAEVIDTDDSDWLSEFKPETELPPAIELQPVASGDLDWLEELEAAAEPAAVSAEDFPWMAEDEEAAADEPLVAEPAAAASDDLDWLSELEPEAEAEPEPVVVAASEDDFSWMASDDEDAAEAEPEPAAVASVIPDWLSELEPEAETEPEAAAEEPIAAAASEDDFAWMADEEEATEAEPDAEPVAAEAPDWLTDLQPVSEQDLVEADEVGEEVAAVAASLDDDDDLEADDDAFAASLEQEEILEPTPAHNAPDWLNAMVPGLDVDYEAADEEFTADEEDEEMAFGSEEREYAWVEEMVEEETAAVESAAFAFSRPPAWFASLNALRQGGKTEDEFPDWISDDADADLPDYLR